jgi:rubredoxin
MVTVDHGRYALGMPGKRDVNRKPARDVTPDEPWREYRGNEGSSAQDFERKRWSEEASLLTCPECGFAKGRHAKICSHATAD